MRCDKSIPCSTCVRRGLGDSCIRETVIVRGRVTTGQDPAVRPTYEDLLRENAELRRTLAERGQDDATHHLVELPRPTRCRAVQNYADNGDDDDSYETKLIKATATLQSSGEQRQQQHDVILPSRQCSQRLIDHDKSWNSWIHYAVEYPQFEDEHRSFMNRLDSGGNLDGEDPSWLAIYFAVITVRMACT